MQGFGLAELQISLVVGALILIPVGILAWMVRTLKHIRTEQKSIRRDLERSRSVPGE